MLSLSTARSVPAALRALPRESRDTLFLLATVAWVIAPQLGRLPPWAIGLSVLVLGWRGLLAWRSAPLPGRAWRAFLALAAVVATALTYRSVAGREAGVTLVVMLLVLKTLELRARRDAMVVFFLGFFVMLTNFFFSQALPTAVAMVIALAGLLTALVQAHMPVGRPSIAEAGGTALRLMLYGAPVMAALFLFFPRLAPLWGAPGGEERTHSGLSSDMRVGTIARLALDDGVAMRIQFLDTPDGKPPPQQDLYFRGPVLSSFDGRNWRSLGAEWGAVGDYVPQSQRGAKVEVSGTPIRYEATLEPSGHPWLLVLDAAPEKPEGTDGFLTADLQWVTARPLNQLVRYHATSFPDFRYGTQLTPLALRTYTALPAGFDPRTHELAQELTRSIRPDLMAPAAGTRALVNAALQRLRSGGYTYTLDPGIYGANTADQFWFDVKEGFCEHIASAFVVLMRAMNVPSRIVTGYQGGEVNSVDGLWTVRQSDAHAWAEVWEADRGWTRVDPTAAVSPGRIGSVQRLQAPRGVFSEAFGAVIGVNFGQHIRAVWEAVNNRWNQWVLNYTQSRQLDLMKRLGFSAPDWQDLLRLLAGLIVVAAAIGATWAVLERRTRDPWVRLLHKAYRKLQRAGVPVAAHTAPRGAASTLRRCLGRRHDVIGNWLLKMEAQRYARLDPAARSAALRAVRREFRGLRWPEAVPRRLRSTPLTAER
jgi:transglutaminase-like putative cysteine protease